MYVGKISFCEIEQYWGNGNPLTHKIHEFYHFRCIYKTRCEYTKFRGIFGYHKVSLVRIWFEKLVHRLNCVRWYMCVCFSVASPYSLFMYTKAILCTKKVFFLWIRCVQVIYIYILYVQFSFCTRVFIVHSVQCIQKTQQRRYICAFVSQMYNMAYKNFSLYIFFNRIYSKAALLTENGI